MATPRSQTKSHPNANAKISRLGVLNMSNIKFLPRIQNGYIVANFDFEANNGHRVTFVYSAWSERDSYLECTKIDPEDEESGRRIFVETEVFGNVYPISCTVENLAKALNWLLKKE